jgi:hypothetical protein
MNLFALDAGRLHLHRRRKAMNAVALTLSLAAMAFGFFGLPRADVLALAQLLTAKQGPEIAPAIRDDVARFIEAVGSEVTASLLADLRINDTPEDLWARLRAAYGAAP